MNPDDKLKMAHEFVMNCIKNPTVTLKADDIQNIINNSWVYADEMEKQYNQRKESGLPDVLKGDRQPLIGVLRLMGATGNNL